MFTTGNVLLLQCLHSMGKALGSINKISIKQMLKYSAMNNHANNGQTSLSYQEYGALKLMDVLTDIKTNDNSKIPIDVLNIIINYTNGEIYKCKSCNSKITLYNTKEKTSNNISSFNKHELLQKGFHLLKDNKTIICNSCAYFNGNFCYRCHSISYDLFGFKLGLCDHCDFGVSIQMAIIRVYAGFYGINIHHIHGLPWH